MMPLAALVDFALWAIVFKVSGYVSLASIVAALALPVLVILATTAVRPRVVAAVTVGLSLLILPDGLGLAVRTKLPGAFLVSAALGYGVWRAADSRRRRAVPVARRDDPATPRSTG